MGKKGVAPLVWFMGIVWAVVLIASGVALPAHFFRPVSAVTTATVLVLWAFDLWIWAWPVISWLARRPDLRGTWCVEMDSTWRASESGPAIGSIVGYLVIRQTYSSLSARLLTAESSSRTCTAAIVRDEDGLYQLVAVYVNEPRYVVRERSPIHYGGLVVSVIDGSAPALRGHYWTDRDTGGGFRADDRHPECHESFEEAEKAFASTEAAGG